MSEPARAEPPLPAASDTPAAPPRRRRWLWIGGSLVLLLVLVFGGSGGGLWWALGSDAGTAWLLSKVPGLQVAAPRGALLKDFEAERIEFALPAGGGRVVLSGFGWRGLAVQRLAWKAQPAGWARITIDELHAQRVDVVLTPADPPQPLREPASLRLPVQVAVKALRVGELHLAALGTQPLRELRGAVELGGDGGAVHRIDGLSLRWDQLGATGRAQIAADAPFALDVAARAEQQAAAAPASAASAAPSSAPAAASAPAPAPAATPWRAEAFLNGPLAQPTLKATVRGRAIATRAEQTLDARAVLRPFAAWPLGELRAEARDLDLSALASAAPATALSGSASADTRGLDQAARVTVDLANARAGLWNEGLLPLRRLQAELRGRPDDRRALELHRLDAELGTARSAAGRLQGSGHWTPERVDLDATLDAVVPALLDARAPAMQLSGSIGAVLSGLGAGPAGAPAIEFKADLAGPLSRVMQAVGVGAGPTAPAPPRPATRSARDARIQLDLGASAQRIELRQAVATLGAAKASLSGSASRATPAAPWNTKGQASLVDFDPLPWWPGRDDAPLRRGPHRLNASAEFDLVVPVAPAASKPAASPGGWQASTGTARLEVARSLLAGVALSGQASARRAAGGGAQFTVKADLAGNQVDASGEWRGEWRGVGPGARGAAADVLAVKLAAPELARLAPLWRLLTGGGPDAALAGAVTGEASLRGRWPDISSTGRLDASALRLGLPGPGSGTRLQAQAVKASWQLGTAANARVELQLDASGLALPGAGGAAGPALETLQIGVEGNAASHRLSLNAESKSLPPAWVDTLQAGTRAAAAPAGGRTVASLQAQGGLTGPGGAAAASGERAWAASGWRGTLGSFEVRRKDAAGAPWLRTSQIGVQAQWAGGPARVVVQPGQVEALGATLRFERIAWQAAVPGGSPAQIDAQAELVALPVAPLLARLQPDFGWGGDLAVSGRLLVKSAPTFSADIVLERARGDLTVTDEVGTQALGLSDLRLGLNAQNGIWSFTQGLAGKTLGVAAGAVVARTSPSATWPAADTPIEGVLELQVANLGTWGTWVPAGWRLGGALRTSATIGGRFAAPEYTGQVLGTGLSVRNFVQGVNVSDGDVAITLAGATARIERFSAKAGGGSVSLTGDASLGETPRAALTLRAERFQVLGRVDRRVSASGQAQLQLERGALALDGRFSIDEGLFDFTRSDAPSLSDDVVVLRGRTSQAAAAPAAPPPAAPAGRVALDLSVDLGNKLRLRGRGLDTGLRGELRITSPGNRFTLNGTVTTADGTYDAYGQKLVIDRGAIAFSGSPDNPRLDIEATRPNLDTRVGVRISGNTANPRIRLFSEPELSELDKLSWLVLGRASDGLGRTDTALLQRAAVALLAGEGDGVTGQFTKAIGLDDVSLRQTEGEVRETVISLGKQLSRRWYVGYERGLNATTGTWQLIYRIAQRFTLRAQSGLDNSLDVIWTWRWQ